MDQPFRKEPQLIGKFLRRFAQQGWQVSMEPVRQEAAGKSQVLSEGNTEIYGYQTMTGWWFGT